MAAVIYLIDDDEAIRDSLSIPYGFQDASRRQGSESPGA